MPQRELTAAERHEVLRLLWPSPGGVGGYGDHEERDEDAQRWRQQRLELPSLSDDNTVLFPLGLRQTHGGPCGVLAAVQAELLRLVMFPSEGDASALEGAGVGISISSSIGRGEGSKGREEAASGDALQRLVARIQQTGDQAHLRLLTLALASVLFRCGQSGRSDNRDSDSSSGRRSGVSGASGAEVDGSGSVLVRLVVLRVADRATEEEAVHDVTVSDAHAQLTRPEVWIEDEIFATHASDPALLSAVHSRLDAFQAAGGVLSFVFSAVRTKSVAAIRTEMDDQDAALIGPFGHCSQELLNLLLIGDAVSNVFDGSVPLGGPDGGPDVGLTLRGVRERASVGYLTQLEALRYCQVGSNYKSPVSPVWVIGSTSHFSVCFGLDRAICVESASRVLFQRVQRVFNAFDAHETGFMAVTSLADSLQQLGVPSTVLSSEASMARLVSRLEVTGAGIILSDEYWKVVSVLLHTGDLELALSGGYSSDRDATEAGGDCDAHFQETKRLRSDSDLARELQAEFDAEASGSRTQSTPPLSTADATRTTARTAPPETDDVFTLYYYNGLGGSGANARQPQLAKCRVTVPRPVAFIGKSVPLAETGGGGGSGYAAPPLEEILKTKWPSARFDWFGRPVPSVD